MLIAQRTFRQKMGSTVKGKKQRLNLRRKSCFLLDLYNTIIDAKKLLGRKVVPHSIPPMAGDQHKQCNYPIHASCTIRIQHALESRIQV